MYITKQKLLTYIGITDWICFQIFVYLAATT